MGRIGQVVLGFLCCSSFLCLQNKVNFVVCFLCPVFDSGSEFFFLLFLYS
jgi:hypothetical protein